MKIRTILKTLAVSTLLMGSVELMAQQAPQSQGKPIITLFGDAGVGTDNGDLSKLGFNLERAYLGYEYGFNEHWKAKVVYDMGKGDDNSLQRLGYVKNAEIDYHHNNLSVKIGLTGTSQFNYQEKFWGYRYVAKSFQDLNKWGSSADLGISTSYKLNDLLSADISVFNGEGYKKVQADDQLQYAIGLTATPVKGFSVRAYGEMKTAKDTVAQYAVALFAGYKCDAFRIGAEYNMQLNHGYSENHNLQGLSVYGVGKVSKNIEVFVRYDYGSSQSEDMWTYGQDGSSELLGFQYKINQLFSIAPNVRFSQSQDGSNKSMYACVSAKVNL